MHNTAETEKVGLVTLTLTINGNTYTRDIEPRTLLVEFIRDEIGLTGTHIGCDTSYCGACTILLNGEIVKSCTALAIQADGGEVLTVEGLEQNGELHALQRSFSEQHGLQCGFCTPGMMMSAYDLLKNNPKPTLDEIKKAISGNVCRCTGYQNIYKAIDGAADLFKEVK
jgi:carbon-monoxide dehydrogenase small subunit